MTSWSSFLRDAGPRPSGPPEAWRARYEPFIEELLVHREVPKARVSVCVVAWRAGDDLLACARHLRAQEGLGPDDVQLILIDNGELTCSRDALRELFDLEFRMRENVSLSPGRNIAAAWATAPVLASIDDDGLVRPGYLERGLAYFEDPTVFAVRSRIVARRHRYFTALADHYDRGDTVVEDLLVTEGSSLLRRDVLLEVGGFTDRLFGHEGIELCYRVDRAHLEMRVLYAPDVVMAHDYFHTWEKFYRKNFMYAGIGARVGAQDPGLAAFIERERGARHAGAELSRDEAAARHALRVARRILWTGAWLKSRVTTSSDTRG